MVSCRSTNIISSSLINFHPSINSSFCVGTWYTACILGINISLSWPGSYPLRLLVLYLCLDNKLDGGQIDLGASYGHWDGGVGPRIDGLVDIPSVHVGSSY